MKRYISKKTALSIIAFVLFVTLAILLLLDNRKTLTVIEEESFYRDFYVENEKVYVKCLLTIKNHTDYKKEFTLTADMKIDQANNLLRESRVSALNEQGDEEVFEIIGNEIKAFEVVFVGNFGGNNEKFDRNLPPNIRINIVK